MKKPTLFAELARRNVLRAGALYAAGAWVLVQVATQVFPLFNAPVWVLRWIVVAAVIGLPFALLFPWLYEWTPQGIQRMRPTISTSPVPADPRSAGRSRGRITARN